MERMIPLLKYLESVGQNGSITLTGLIHSEKTELSYLKDRTKIIKVRFQAVFNSVSEIETLDSTWIRENGIAWEMISWTSGLKANEYIAYSTPSEVFVYLTFLKPQIKVKSSSPQILSRIEEYCHSLGTAMITMA